MPEGLPGILDPTLSAMPPGLQLADLMAWDQFKTLGMSALQDLAKIAERWVPWCTKKKIVAFSSMQFWMSLRTLD